MKNEIIHKVGIRIKELRLEKKLTQEMLAQKSRISLKYIQRVEGKNPPDLGLTSLQKLAEGFEMPLWQLLQFD